MRKYTLTGRCLSCLEQHPPETMCPPHEVRTTGRAFSLVYIEELEAEVERLQASNKELVAAFRYAAESMWGGDAWRQAKAEWWIRCREAIKAAEATPISSRRGEAATTVEK